MFNTIKEKEMFYPQPMKALMKMWNEQESSFFSSSSYCTSRALGSDLSKALRITVDCRDYILYHH